MIRGNCVSFNRLDERKTVSLDPSRQPITRDALLLDQGLLLVWSHDGVFGDEEVASDVDEQVGFFESLDVVFRAELLYCLPGHERGSKSDQRAPGRQGQSENEKERGRRERGEHQR